MASKVLPRFYDMIEEDLLSLVEESRISDKVLEAMNTAFLALIPKKD
jgi:hypothetical protein